MADTRQSAISEEKSREAATLIERIRTRPGMYFGGVETYGLHFVIDDVITNVVGWKTADVSALRLRLDDGRRFQIHLNGQHDVRLSHFVTSNHDVDGGLDGAWTRFGLGVLIAVSSELSVTLTTQGQRVAQQFAAGQAVGDAQETASSDEDSLSITGELDGAVFSPTARWDYLNFCGRIQELAVHEPGTRFTIESADCIRQYHYPDGLRSYASEVFCHTFGRWPMMHCSIVEGDLSAETVIFRELHSCTTIHSFANGRRTYGHGSHVDGFQTALRRLSLGHQEDLSGSSRNPLAGIAAVIAVTIPEPTYADTVKETLVSKRAAEIVYEMVISQLPAQWK